jgi:hypothetical protein
MTVTERMHIAMSHLGFFGPKISVALRCLSMPFLRPAKMPVQALMRWDLVGAGAVAFFEGS